MGGTIRVGTISTVPHVLRSFGLNPRQVLSEINFDLKLFSNPDNLVSYSLRNRVLTHCANATGCQHFGLIAAEHSGLDSLGALGLLIRSSPDVGSALQNLLTYFRFHTRSGSASLRQYEDLAVFGYHILESDGEPNRQLSDGAIVFMRNLMRELCGVEWNPREVWSMHSQPESVEPYRKFFTARLRFDAEYNALLFSKSWLDRPLPAFNAGIYRLVKKELESQLDQNTDSLAAMVRSIISTDLLGTTVSEEYVAAQLDMHPRKLRRKLIESQTSYRKLLDGVRFEVAKQLLTDSELKINAIALRLQYTDARSFIRAFKRWSGETPARWRSVRRKIAATPPA